ncbi:MAG: twin-arginine translocase TatA/TatE family subunit [Actinomycetota bacterium]|nr:twin-arginine translocase TatA/TatE family subunit [Actinomycetota bacterium]
MPGFIGLPEILLLGLVVLLVFGPKRLPEMGRSMGRGFREFKDSVTGDNKDALDPFAIPAEEPEIALPAPTQGPPAVVTSPPSIATVPSERTLSRPEREDEKVA